MKRRYLRKEIDIALSVITVCIMIVMVGTDGSDLSMRWIARLSVIVILNFYVLGKWGRLWKEL